MDWIKVNTAKSDKFLLITQTPEKYWGMDNTSEWFPALTERVSIITPQGTEWLSQKFYKRVDFYGKLKDCYDQGLNCLENAAKKEGVDFGFIYLEKDKQDSGFYDKTSLLKHNLFESLSYSVVYENDGAILFAKKG